MYFKLVIASVALMCVGVASGRLWSNCYGCYGHSAYDPQAVINCRRFINITERHSCEGYCVFLYGTVIGETANATLAMRYCSRYHCMFITLHGGVKEHCSDCEHDYCNTQTY
ncbi:uncharacterized protein LOC116178947 [Photinus pyralis]|uniref:uncharacterized protein LOC116178947 n=1 Tax=Photinus pyralis TaxID=7054 RepID=UPI0012677594|nr:uncharacterized protein LOC116178947 [Photinus pyralis]